MVWAHDKKQDFDMQKSFSLNATASIHGVSELNLGGGGAHAECWDRLQVFVPRGWAIL